MKSGARTYFAGAMVSAALIAVACIAFVALVSLRAPEDWPVSDLGLRLGSGDEVGLSGAVKAGDGRAVDDRRSAPARGASLAATGTTGAAVHAAGSPLGEQRRSGSGSVRHGTSVSEAGAIAPASADVVSRAPGAQSAGGADSAPPAPSPGSSEPVSAPTPAEGGGEDKGEGRGGEPPFAIPPVPSSPDLPEAGEAPEVGESPEAGEAPPPVGNAPLPPGEEEGAESTPPDEVAETPPGDVVAPEDPALELQPGALRAEIAHRGLADPALAAPGLVDMTADG
jgi:hypothetical protein